LNWRALKNLNLTIFRNELHIQALQSIIKMQADQIESLKKDKDFYIGLYHDATNRIDKVEVMAPLDPTPLDNLEHWKPLREAKELPSERRARLERKFKVIANAKKEAKMIMEDNE